VRTKEGVGFTVARADRRTLTGCIAWSKPTRGASVQVDGLHMRAVPDILCPPMTRLDAPQNRRLRLLRTSVATTLVAMALAAPASAEDETAPRGRVVKLRVNTPHAADHASFHGSITLKQANGKSQQYLWGGSTCPGQMLDAAQVQVLVTVHLNRSKTWVEPVFAPSKGGDRRCLVAFELSS